MINRNGLNNESKVGLNCIKESKLLTLIATRQIHYYESKKERSKAIEISL